ncbi:MAG: 50S ribosomal protein L11 methyltransferase, partial [Bacteroidota bacterium]
MSYHVLHFSINPEIPGRDIIIAVLSQFEFDSFAETNQGIDAYIASEKWTSELESQIRIIHIPNVEFQFESEKLEEKNWNEEWESQFEPIVIGEKCVIRAPFHSEFSNVLNIIIEPKMSFGTGHHATTYLMTEACFNLDLKDKVVVDMGSGTAVLAIVAEKLGAKQVFAIDIDNWAFENALENILRNNCTKIEAKLGEVEHLDGLQSDIFLANINRNILVNQAQAYTQVCKPNSFLLLSGFYETDVPPLLNAFT